jgi:integrase
MALDDPQDFSGGLANARRRLLDSDDVHDDDRPIIRQWMQRKDGRVAVSSLKTYLRRVRLASERSDIPLVDLDESDYHDLVFRLRHEEGLADSTVKSYEDALVLFLTDMTDAEWPADIERTTVENGGPNPDEMLIPADIQELTATARHQRDVAFIEFLADTGARLSLALSLRVKDIDLSEPATYTPNPNATGLKGADIKEYPLIDSVAALRGYLRGAHPRGSTGDVALFHKLKPASRGEDDRWGSDDGALRANAARQQLVRIADRSSVEKRVHPHGFRHAAITRMVREGYSRSQIEHRVHWTLDTDMWETYEHITSEEHNTDIFREAGVVDDEDGPDRVRKPCGNCRTPVAPHHEFCPQCGAAVTATADTEVDASRDAVLDDLINATNPAMRRELRQVLEDLDEREDLAHSDPS